MNYSQDNHDHNDCQNQGHNELNCSIIFGYSVNESKEQFSIKNGYYKKVDDSIKFDYVKRQEG